MCLCAHKADKLNLFVWFVEMGFTAAPTNPCSEVDLEIGGNVCIIDDSSRNLLSDVKVLAKCLVSKVCSQFAQGSEGSVSLSANASDSGVENVKVVAMSMNVEGKEANNVEEKKLLKEKRKKESKKKAPKPPKCPKPPTLDAADLKLIRELSELARLKRARMERMKAMKKAKVPKAPTSSNSNILSLLLTALLCFVIIFQGISSRSSNVNMPESPVPTGATEGSWISVQFFGNPIASDPNGPYSESPYLVEQVSGLDSQNQPRRFSG